MRTKNKEVAFKCLWKQRNEAVCREIIKNLLLLLLKARSPHRAVLFLFPEIKAVLSELHPDDTAFARHGSFFPRILLWLLLAHCIPR